MLETDGKAARQHFAIQLCLLGFKGNVQHINIKKRRMFCQEILNLLINHLA